jgi:hypothetical protein
MDLEEPMHRSRTLVVAGSAALVLAGCGSSGGTHATATTTQAAPISTAPPTAAPYQPNIDPAKFTDQVTNKYFPLKSGTTLVFEGLRDGQPQRTEMAITSETKMIMGVKCVVIRDTNTSNGALVEKTTDWYAQTDNGDVWYFGEATAEYTNGSVSSTKGSWEAGVDGAQPGIIMEANPKPGDRYHQEYRPGVAEDIATVSRIEPSLQVPGGTFQNVVVTEDRNPLDPDKLDTKKYAAGVGLVHTVRDRTGHHEEAAYIKTIAG